MKVAVIVHVFYPERWSELAACIRSIGDCDLFVTCVAEEAVADARRDFPNARFVACENRGYDVWPFLKVLRLIDLAQYDVVVKLHTKRDVASSGREVVGGTRLDGPRWRNHLLRFVRTPENWRETVRRFDDPAVGMVADRHVIFLRRDGGCEDDYDRARDVVERGLGLRVGGNAGYVGGTMFAVRARLLRPLLLPNLSADAFEPSGDRAVGTLAHVLERACGLAVAAQGFRLVPFRGSFRMHRVLGALLRFFLDERHSAEFRSIRICGLVVYRKRLHPLDGEGVKRV